MEKQAVNLQPSLIHDEHILVVRKSQLFEYSHPWHGINDRHIDSFLSIINEKKEFHPRSLMEQDIRYKQIIPYIVFSYGNDYFFMQRSAKASETRLKSKWTLGIGGHVRQEDLSDSSLFSWAQREFHEEVSYQGTLTVKLLGLLNDDTDDVGKVHMGIVFLACGDSAAITVKSELQSGSLVPLDTCHAKYDSLEKWSQFIVDFLRKTTL